MPYMRSMRENIRGVGRDTISVNSFFSKRNVHFHGKISLSNTISEYVSADIVVMGRACKK